MTHHESLWWPNRHRWGRDAKPIFLKKSVSIFPLRSAGSRSGLLFLSSVLGVCVVHPETHSSWSLPRILIQILTIPVFQTQEIQMVCTGWDEHLVFWVLYDKSTKTETITTSYCCVDCLQIGIVNSSYLKVKIRVVCLVLTTHRSPGIVLFSGSSSENQASSVNTLV